MRITIPEPQYQVAVLLRRAGYSPFQDPNTAEYSFIRRLGTQFYPRFHLYVQRDDDTLLELNLHLDQKKPSYSGSHAHSGEYDGAVVEDEKKRILQYIGG